MPAVATRYDYGDYVRLPDDGTRYEVLNGTLARCPSPNFFHQRASARLFNALYSFVEAHGLGIVLSAPFDVIFGRHDILVPDLVFVSEGRMDILERRGATAAPDLVVEILSPSTRTRDLTAKRDLYERYRVPAYWIVDPEDATVTVYRLVEGRYAEPETLGEGDTVTPGLLPGFEVTVERVFS